MLTAHGLPLEALSPSASRADAAKFSGQSEKTQTRAPWSNCVAIRLLALASDSPAPACIDCGPGGFSAMTVEQAECVGCDRLLLVENLETFRYLEDYRWLWDIRGPHRVMAIYRGDRAFSSAESSMLLARRSEPVWAFMDFDPAGLGLASILPRLEHLVLPNLDWLAREIEAGQRPLELFERSRQQYAASLQRAQNQQIAKAWALMSDRSRGLAQEAMRDAPTAA